MSGAKWRKTVSATIGAPTQLTQAFYQNLANIKIDCNNKSVNDLAQNQFNSLYSGNDLIIAGK